MQQSVVLGSINLLVTTVCLFLTYRVALSEVGTTGVGIWSLTVALTSISRIYENGFIYTVIRNISNSVGSKSVIARSITIAIFGIILASTSIMLLAIIPVYLIISNFYAEILNEVTMFLPLIAFSTIVSSASLVSLSILDSLKKFISKSIANITGALILLALSIILIPEYGIYGLVVAQLIQAISVLFISMIILNYHVKLSLTGCSINEIQGYITSSASVAFISVTHFVTEPLTKMLVSYFGGMELAGVFDLAAKLINQIRQLIVAGNQAILPFIKKHQKFDLKLQSFYRSNLILVSHFSIAIFHIPVLFSHELSQFFFAEINEAFKFTLIALLGATCVNVYTIPGYFLTISQGKMKINTYGHVALAVANIIFSYTFGQQFGYYGVVLGYCLSSIIVSLSMVIMYEKFVNGSSWRKTVIIPIRLTTISISGCALVYLFAKLIENINELEAITALTIVFAIKIFTSFVISAFVFFSLNKVLFSLKKLP